MNKKLIITLLMVVSSTVTQAETFIGKNNCAYMERAQIRRVPTTEIAIVIDQSEELSPSHKAQLKQMISELLLDEKVVPIGAHISIYQFGKDDFKPDGSGQKILPVVDVCKPASDGNALIANRKKIDKNFQSKYLLPLQSGIDQSVKVAYGERSPIFETVQYVSNLKTITSSSRTGNNKLILVSDLLQHSELISSYKKQYQVPENLVADLSNWDVQILQPARYGKDKGFQTKQNNEMWKSYFKTSGVKSDVNIQVLP